MIDEPTQALFAYGQWLYVKRYQDSDRPQLANGAVMDEPLMQALPDDCEELWGLVHDVPCEVVQSSMEGYIETRDLLQPDGPVDKTMDWSIEDQLLIVHQSNHCWAEVVGNTRYSSTEVSLKAFELLLPSPLGAKRLYIPTVDGAIFKLRYPISVPDGLYEESLSWIAMDKGLVKSGMVSAVSYDFNPSVHNENDQKTAMFQSQLEHLFALLKREGIFGCNAYGQGWRPGEGGDIAASRWHKQMIVEFGPHYIERDDIGDMLLCWCDTEYHTEDDRYGLAIELYSANGMHEEWQDRVDIHCMPLTCAVTSVGMYYDGPAAADKKRIGEAIVKHAPAAGLATTWNGNIDECVWVWAGK